MAFNPDYIDADVAYLLGLVVARGTLLETSQIRQLTIEFPFRNLEAEGIKSKFDQATAIRLGLGDIRERLLELLDTDITIVRKNDSIDFVIRFLRHSMIWRNLNLSLGGRTSYQFFQIPEILFAPELPFEVKREFVRGFADVAGNIRHANRYVDGRHRVRLDILNFKTNWELPVKLCLLLQEQLHIPVQLITWGHPNLGRDFREHQLNIFAEPFATIGFSLEHKQKILQEFIAHDKKLGRHEYHGCPGIRPLRDAKPKDRQEKSGRLDPRLQGKHFDAYWQICKALGCPRVPAQGSQPELVMETLNDTDKTSNGEPVNVIQKRKGNVPTRRRLAEWISRTQISQGENSGCRYIACCIERFYCQTKFTFFFPPEWVTYDLHVDVTGFILSKEHAQLVFVECKLPVLTLAHLSQLLGYSRIALPLFSFLISPAGCSDSVISLIKTYARGDVSLGKRQSRAQSCTGYMEPARAANRTIYLAAKFCAHNSWDKLKE